MKEKMGMSNGNNALLSAMEMLQNKLELHLAFVGENRKKMCQYGYVNKAARELGIVLTQKKPTSNTLATVYTARYKTTGGDLDLFMYIPKENNAMVMYGIFPYSKDTKFCEYGFTGYITKVFVWQWNHGWELYSSRIDPKMDS